MLFRNVTKAVPLLGSSHPNSHPHSHPSPLLSLRGDALGPLVMSLWVQSGVLSVQSEGVVVFPPTWMIVVTAVSPATLRQSLSRWEAWSAGVACSRALPKLWPLGAGLPSVLCCSPSLSRRWSRAGSVSLVRVPTRLPVVLPRLNLSESLRRCNVSLSWVALGSTFPTSLPTVVCSPSPRLVSVVLRVPLPSMRLNGCSRLSWKNSRRVRFSNPWLRAMLLGGNVHLDITWITGWLGVSSVALFGIAPVGLCVRARWRPVFMAGLSIGGGVLFGSGSGIRLRCCLFGSFPPRFCPPFFLAWRAWPIIFVKDGEPGVFRSGPGRQARNATTRRSYQRYLSQLELPGHSGLGLVQWYSCHYCLGCDLLTGQFSGARSCEIYLSLPDCDELGTWNHICWTCSKRPSTMTRPHDWLARFGWSLFTDQTDTVAQVRAWLHTCQTKVWELRRNS